MYDADELTGLVVFDEFQDYLNTPKQSVCNYDAEWDDFRSDIFPHGWQNPKFKPWFHKIWSGWDVMLTLVLDQYSVSIFKDATETVSPRTYSSLMAAMLEAFKLIQSKVLTEAHDREAFKLWYAATKPKHPDTTQF